MWRRLPESCCLVGPPEQEDSLFLPTATLSVFSVVAVSGSGMFGEAGIMARPKLPIQVLVITKERHAHLLETDHNGRRGVLKCSIRNPYPHLHVQPSQAAMSVAARSVLHALRKLVRKSC